VVALNGQHRNIRLLQGLETDLGLVKGGGLNVTMLKQIASDQDKINSGLQGIEIQDTIQGPEKVLSAFWAVVAIKTQMNVRKVEKLDHYLFRLGPIHHS
jgi:hypothetical protein